MSENLIWQIECQIYQALKQDPLLCQMLENETPSKTPLIQFSKVQINNFTTSSGKGAKLLFYITIFDRDKTAFRCFNIASKINKIISQLKIKIDGYHMVYLNYVNSEINRKDGISHQINQKYKLYMEENYASL